MVALPFSYVAIICSGVVVSSITYTDSTHIGLNLNTVNATVGRSIYILVVSYY